MPGERRPTARGVLLAVALAALSRAPFFPDFPASFDALNYMLALNHMDMRLHQPQPPGYPLYILLGRALLWLTGDPHRALLWLSAGFSALGGLLICALGERMYSRRTGFLAALLLVSAPAVWYQSELAAPYTADLWFSLWIAWLSYRTFHEEQRMLPWALALSLGLAGAFRPQTMVFLTPLAAAALGRRGGRVLLGGGTLAAAVFALFFAPIVAASGGLPGYRAALGHITEIPAWGRARLSGAARLLRNALTLLRLTFGAASEPVWLLALAGGARSLRPPLQGRGRLRFFLLWILPSWAVYILLWPGNRGTILVTIAPVYLLAAAGLDALIRRRPALGKGLSAAVLLWQAALFACLPQQPFGPAWRRYDNAATIRWKAAYYRNRIEAIRALPAEGTLVYAIEFRHPQVYLPQYHTFSPPIFDPQGSGKAVSIIEIRDGERLVHRDPALESLIPPGVRRIVLFDLPPEILHAPRQWLVSLPMPQAAPLTLLTLPPGARAWWTAEGIWAEAAR